MKFTGESRSTARKTCPSARLYTTNLTWTDPRSNLGLRGVRPATNCLSHGPLKNQHLFMFLRKHKDKQYVCGHNILTDGVSVTQLPSNAGISV
jgi:hypothetical protein